MRRVSSLILGSIVSQFAKLAFYFGRRPRQDETSHPIVKDDEDVALRIF
jgi:hypothetical protein